MHDYVFAASVDHHDFPLFIIILTVSMSSQPVSSPSPFSLSMSCLCQPTSIDCKFDYINNSDEDYYLCKRYTPLEGIRNRILKVTDEDGTNVRYSGILAKRGPVQKNEYTLVKSGETVSVTIQLNHFYTFERNGKYKIEYDRPLVCISAKEMSRINNDKDLPSGGFDPFYASTEVLLENVSSLERLRRD